MKTDQELMRKLAETARSERRCDSVKSFNMGASGTALVTCSCRRGHGGNHTRVDSLPDGSSINFRWSS